MKCKNCNEIANGSFCIHCGQSTTVSKINLPNFLSETSSTIFQIDRGLFYTIKELFIRPGHSIREYIEGKRKNHFKPIAYLLMMSTIYFLVSQLMKSGTLIDEFIIGFSMNHDPSQPDTFQVEIMNWFADKYAYSMLLLLPLFTLASYLIFFKSGYNYLEHFVLNSYITGQQAIIYSLFSTMGLIIDDHDLLVTIAVCITSSYTFFVFWQFFPKKNRIVVILQSILTYILYLLILSVTIMIMLFIVQ